jgi:phosphatidylglycerol---prolipoprotein diacylglyceryl transferase
MTLPAICYGLGYLTGVLAFAWMAKRRGMASGPIWIVMQAGLIGGLLGANLAQWVLGGAAGKTVLGGVAGGWLAVAAAKRYLGLRQPTGDLFAVAICAGEAVGRLGCFTGGCCYGRACELPWRVWQHGGFRHPTQLYLSLACAIILAVLLVVERGRPPINRLFYLQGLLYCGARFAVEFFRAEAPSWAGLTVAQWACLAGATVFGWLLSARRLEDRSAPPVVVPALEGES